MREFRSLLRPDDELHFRREGTTIVNGTATTSVAAQSESPSFAGVSCLRLKLLREARGLSQAQLAALCGIGQPNIAHYESGDRVPSVRTVRRIARALGCEVRDVFETEDIDEEILTLYRMLVPERRALLVAIARCMCETSGGSAPQTTPYTPPGCETSSSAPGGQ